MNTTIVRTALALVVIAAPLSAQVNPRHGQGRKTTTTTTTSTGDVGSILRGDRVSSRAERIPPGQLPPRGMCRLWIDNVPPGQQPGVSDCATAERQRLTTPNSHVIYGDEQSFPGRGKGKFKNRRGDQNTANSRSCAVWDVVVVAGKQVPVCRSTTPNGSVIDRRNRGDDDNEIDDDRDDDDDRFEHRSREERNGDRAERRDREDRDDRLERGGKRGKSEGKRQGKRGKGRDSED